MNAAETKSLGIWTEAERERLMKTIAVLPHPKQVAWSLPEHALYALANAEQGRNGQFRLRHGVRGMAAGDELFRAGLAEAGGPYIGSFGMLVRREAIALLLERDDG